MLVNNFVLSDTKVSIFKPAGPLNTGGTVDYLCWEHYQQFAESCKSPTLWDVIDSFILIVHASLATLGTVFQQLLASVNVALDMEGLF